MTEIYCPLKGQYVDVQGRVCTGCTDSGNCEQEYKMSPVEPSQESAPIPNLQTSTGPSLHPTANSYSVPRQENSKHFQGLPHIRGTHKGRGRSRIRY